jgi:hypothetical protein
MGSMRFSGLKAADPIHILRPLRSRVRGKRCVHHYHQVISRPRMKNS